MTTTTPPSGVTFAHAAAMLAAHLAGHALPEPVSLSVATSYGDSTVTAQLRGDTVPGIAAELLIWADTLSTVTVEAWRPLERDRVHLSVHGTLTGSTCAIKLKVFGGVDYEPLRFADLQPDSHRGISLPLAQLHNWAANPPATMGIPVLDASRGAR